MSENKKPKTIAVVVPCYNESESIEKLIGELKKQEKRLANQYSLEIILVDDGSKDGTIDVIKKLSAKYSNLFFRSLSANSGHQAALRAGIQAATAQDAIIMMDGDLQHPPEYIPEMIRLWDKERYAIVQMTRQDSGKDAGPLKYLTSKLYYKIINSLSGLNLEYGSSDFRIIDKSIAKSVQESKENDLFLRGYFSWIKASRVTVGYTPAKRFAGKSKYTFKKMLHLAFQGILQFSEKPLYIGVYFGGLLATGSLIYGAVLTILHLQGSYTVSGWTSLMVVVLLFFGFTFILMGLISIYIAHSIRIEKARPEYIISEEKLSDQTSRD
jgi:dolichol-phosphate mannosyltransferase